MIKFWGTRPPLIKGAKIHFLLIKTNSICILMTDTVLDRDLHFDFSFLLLHLHNKWRGPPSNGTILRRHHGSLFEPLICLPHNLDHHGWHFLPGILLNHVENNIFNIKRQNNINFNIFVTIDEFASSLLKFKHSLVLNP